MFGFVDFAITKQVIKPGMSMISKISSGIFVQEIYGGVCDFFKVKNLK
ncbi:hypothetical protein [Methanobrevibacter sp.]|nr:hypothetical protein [Methanobrevibacter sp.]MDO5859178.1 hypothetical protein [Methanobrevibacter sp.]